MWSSDKLRRPVRYFQGRRFTKNRYGIYTATDGTHRRLHVEVYEYYRGPVEEGYDVWHQDGDRENLAIDNLVMLPLSTIRRLRRLRRKRRT